MRQFYFLFGCLFVFSCTNTVDEPIFDSPEEYKESINSASVTFSFSNAILPEFFEKPSLAYISGFFYFKEDLFLFDFEQMFEPLYFAV